MMNTNLLVCYRFDWRMVTDVSEERIASVFKIKQIEECYLKLGPKQFVVVLCLSWTVVSGLEGCRRLQWDDNSDVEAGCNVKYFNCLRKMWVVHARYHESEERNSSRGIFSEMDQRYMICGSKCVYGYPVPARGLNQRGGCSCWRVNTGSAGLLWSYQFSWTYYKVI